MGMQQKRRPGLLGRRYFLGKIGCASRRQIMPNGAKMREKKGLHFLLFIFFVILYNVSVLTYQHWHLFFCFI
jgi:hypothetical protein